MVNWLALPDELDSQIAHNIAALEDFVAFTATCKSWQTVLPKNEFNPRVPTLFFADSNHHFKYLNHKNQRLSQALSNESCAGDLHVIGF
ncbi:hypothetical protein DCAR_0934532 [Daucus carota subsp. sativus]|uniref:F-box domain-containing protein n=1 Tax=Daucus carota subsp. sativus TaxID=79200 RepID=A0AAF0XX35_DAUCS|nr:hypothetical protein DCAR_0934532 [Daucus carota subsp. sativus]